jgi:hypothetical protein
MLPTSFYYRKSIAIAESKLEKCVAAGTVRFENLVYAGSIFIIVTGIEGIYTN